MSFASETADSDYFGYPDFFYNDRLSLYLIGLQNYATAFGA